MKKRKPPESIVEIVHGLPGSGKSLGAMQTICEWIIRQRRPVYTNLPIRWRVFKKYLAVTGRNPRLSGYLREITKDHVNRFVDKAVILRDYKREGRERAFYLEHGPLIEEGPEANWLPFGSMCIIDEAHMWFPEATKNREPENPNLLRYATMHRHFWHYVQLLSQHPMQISLSWRRQCNSYCEVIDLSRHPMFGDLKTPLIREIKSPIKLLQYSWFPGTAAVNGDTKGSQPIKVRRRLPSLSGGVWFRLYNSHEHGGSQRAMWRKLREVREAIEGATEPELTRWQSVVSFLLWFAGVDRETYFEEKRNGQISSARVLAADAAGSGGSLSVLPAAVASTPIEENTYSDPND